MPESDKQLVQAELEIEQLRNYWWCPPHTSTVPRVDIASRTSAQPDDWLPTLERAGKWNEEVRLLQLAGHLSSPGVVGQTFLY